MIHDQILSLPVSEIQSLEDTKLIINVLNEYN